ncbi:hypothetical protein GH714_040476 [Hevea brasiliensis]|uniref:Bulb-type lectin domain-containing protein n=1 Tax=Hevea brasiliensis TaxID=3981 RepID=A0A6A6L515_HEVBR|nr:hypothetical protein GH714_040476 [Hevea brasiliensis]
MADLSFQASTKDLFAFFQFVWHGSNLPWEGSVEKLLHLAAVKNGFSSVLTSWSLDNLILLQQWILAKIHGGSYSLCSLCVSLSGYIFLGADRISANQSLSGDHTIVSAGGVFALGFFKPGKSSNYYVGMWYKKVSRQTTVWVANREKPVTDKYSSELRISLGNLVLFDGSKIPVWSTNLSTAASNSMEAVLLDEGNLVLRDGSSSSEPLWQSFDHPTDTWLPGVKIRLNKVTGEYTRLVSWKNIEDPAPGPFSLQLDLNETSQFIALFNMSRQYWKSGRWNGELFDVDPEMGMNI